MTEDIANPRSASYITATCLVVGSLYTYMSSTRAELYTVLEALYIVVPLCKDVYFFVEGQADLYAFQSTSPHGL